MSKDHTAPTISKAEAAARLEVNPKTIERLAAAGKLTKIERPGKRGVEVWFLESEVEAVRTERASGTAAPAIVRQSKTDSERQEPDAEMMKAIIGAILQKRPPMLTDGTADKARQTPTVAIENKAFLTIPEAVALSGLGKTHIEIAISLKQLKAISLHGTRGRRIKRTDLDAYIKKL